MEYLNGIPNWDSLGHMLLMLELEAEFGVSISTDDMTNLISLDLLDEYLKGTAPHPEPEELVSGAQD
jgi:hypothetical protein